MSINLKKYFVDVCFLSLGKRNFSVSDFQYYSTCRNWFRRLPNLLPFLENVRSAFFRIFHVQKSNRRVHFTCECRCNMRALFTPRSITHVISCEKIFLMGLGSSISENVCVERFFKLCLPRNAWWATGVRSAPGLVSRFTSYSEALWWL